MTVLSVCRKSPLDFFDRKTPGEGFPLFSCKTAENSPFLRFYEAKRGISPSADGDQGLLALRTSVAFLKKSNAKNFNLGLSTS